MTGKDLHDARLAASLTQEAAARKLGVTQAYLSMVERSRRAASPSLVARVIKALSVPPTALPIGRHATPLRDP
ncbi:MAG: helix-turn-helix transcriptional regulator, partial [Terriglobales bacterium]